MNSGSELPEATHSAVRAEVMRVLREQAMGRGPIATVGYNTTSGPRIPFNLNQLVSSVPDGLVNKKIIDHRPSGTSSFPNYGWPDNITTLIRQTVWELYQQGILAPAPSNRRISSNDLPLSLDLNYYFITPHGVQVLTSFEGHIQVYDPEGYLNVFRSTTPPPDVEMMRYLGECVQVFRNHHLLATVVLLGAASERLLEVFAAHLRDALGSTAQGGEWFKRYSKKWNITEKFDALDGTLKQHYGKRVDARDLTTIRLAFEAIRTVRNDIAHQHTYQPSWNEVNGLLHNFVLYFKSVHRILAILIANPL
jgi:hypothetical protein